MIISDPVRIRECTYAFLFASLEIYQGGLTSLNTPCYLLWKTETQQFDKNGFSYL